MSVPLPFCNILQVISQTQTSGQLHAMHTRSEAVHIPHNPCSYSFPCPPSSSFSNRRRTHKFADKQPSLSNRCDKAWYQRCASGVGVEVMRQTRVSEGSRLAKGGKRAGGWPYS